MADAKNADKIYEDAKRAYPKDATVMDVVLKECIKNGADPDNAKLIIAADVQDKHMSTFDKALHGLPESGANPRDTKTPLIVHDVENDHHFHSDQPDLGPGA